MGVNIKEFTRDNPSPAMRELPLHKGAKVCELSVAEEEMMIGGLRAMVRALVADFNRAAGDDVLYYAECLGFWMLFQKQEDRCDKRVAEGLVRVEDLAALVERLEEEMRGVEDVAPYRKERTTV